MAPAFAQNGFRVAINFSKDQSGARRTAELVAQKGSESLLVQADVSQSSAVNAMIDAVKAEWGRIDVVVNNAGVVRNRTLVKMTDEEWRTAVAVNLDGTFFVTRAVLPLMRAQKSGCLLNVSSYIAERGAHGAGNYAAAKAGVISLTKTTAIEEGRHGIRANVIIPGFHVTTMNEDYWEKAELDIRAQHTLAVLPVADELAEFVVSIANLRTVSGQVFKFESRLS
jgi:3-oxoacyl-[acyl-carrier protein] reductase